MAQRMMRALDFPEVREALRELMEQLQQMGMSKERLEQMREMIQQNMQGLEQQIKQFAGERIAENLSEQPPGESADNLMNRPFHALADDEKKILQRLFIQVLGIQRDECIRPIQCLADRGRLAHLGVSQFLYKFNSLLRELRVKVRDLQADHRKLFLQRGVINEKVQAVTLQGFG